MPHRPHPAPLIALGRQAAWVPTVVLLVAAGLWQGGRLVANPTSAPHSRDALWVSESRLDDGRLLLLVVDQGTRHAAVYHVDGTAGTLTLKSTRDISWDLMVGDFNAQEPRPAALQKMLQLPAAPAVR